MGKELLKKEQVEERQQKLQELIELAENTSYFDMTEIYRKEGDSEIIFRQRDFSESYEDDELYNEVKSRHENATYFVDPAVLADENSGKRIKPEDATYYKIKWTPQKDNPGKMIVAPTTFEEILDYVATSYVPPKPEEPKRSGWGKFRDLFNFMLGKSKSRLKYEEDVKDYPLKLQRRREVFEAGKYAALKDSEPFSHYDMEFEFPELCEYSNDELDEYVRTGKVPAKAGEDVKKAKKPATVGDLKRRAADQVLDACIEANAEDAVLKGCSTIKEYFKDDNNFNTYEGKKIYGFLLQGKAVLNDPNGLNEFKQKLTNVCMNADKVLSAGFNADYVLEKLQKAVVKDNVEDIHKNAGINVK